MKFHVLTLFPDMVMQGLMTSITGRAVQQKKIDIDAVNIRDYTQDKHGRVDDYPYGGGAGMLMQAQPVYDACQSVMEKIPQNKKKRVIYVTPQGIPFTQAKAQELAAQDELLLLCGHYEGIDERVLEEVVTDYISIGDYVLTGGELAAMVIVDAVARLVPGVLEMNSHLTESFHGELLEHPQYSRPDVAREKGAGGAAFRKPETHRCMEKGTVHPAYKGTQAGSVCPLCAAAGMQTTAYETETVAHRYD